MWIALLLIAAAVVFGGIGLLIEGLKWVLIIALVLLIIGLLSGARTRRTGSVRA